MSALTFMAKWHKLSEMNIGEESTASISELGNEMNQQK